MRMRRGFEAGEGTVLDMVRALVVEERTGRDEAWRCESYRRSRSMQVVWQVVIW